MAKKRYKILNVIWADTPDNTLMKVYVENSDPVMESIHSDSPLANQIKKQFSEEDIEKNTDEYKQKLGEETVLFQMFVDNYWEWMEWRQEKENSQIRKANDLNYILSISHNKDDFFKLKLQVFEIDEVKESTDRAWKTKLRKAQSSLELLALLYQEIPDLGSEPILPPDETPVQDVTNQQDSDGSNQEEVSETSDSPTE